MSNRIVSPVDEIPTELSVIDRMDQFQAVLSEFSDTLTDSGRFYLFEMVRLEFATLKSDISIYVRLSDRDG